MPHGLSTNHDRHKGKIYAANEAYRRPECIHLGQPCSSATEFFEQCFSLFQVYSIKAFGKLVIDIGEHGPRLIAAALRCEQPREAHRRAQFPCLRPHVASHRDRVAEVGFSQLWIPLLKP